MTTKKNTEKRIRGWLPKEPPVQPKTQMTPQKPKLQAIPTKAYGATALASLLAGLFLLAAPYYLFPESYAPKADPAWGYTAPATLEGWIVLAAGLALILFSLCAFALWGYRLSVEGSRWAKKTWFTPQTSTGRERSAFKLSLVADGVMVGVFAGTHAITNPATWSLQLTIVSWTLFIVAVVFVNLMLYEYAKKSEPKRT
jgi:hypothetical protein